MNMHAAPRLVETLELIDAAFDALEQAGVRYVYWKSCKGAAAALQGEKDLDLLIKKDDQARATAALLQSGFKLFTDVGALAHPALSSLLGVDPETQRIVHIHLHVAIISGPPLLKQQRLPWEAICLDRAQPLPGCRLRILDPICATLLVLARYALEFDIFDPVALRHARAKRALLQSEISELSSLIDQTAFRELAIDLCGEKTAAVFMRMLNATAPGAHRRRLRARLIRHYNGFALQGTSTRRLALVLRSAMFLTRSVLAQIAGPSRPRRRRPAGRGAVIAIVGLDGSGKSTGVAQARAWLSQEVDVSSLYFGTGDGAPSLVLRPLKALVPLVTSLFPTKPAGASHGHVSDRPPGVLYSSCLTGWAIALAFEKRAKLRAARRMAERGLVVICDRYPQAAYASFNDGPLLPRVKHIPQWLRDFERDIYESAQRYAPDLTIKLTVGVDTVVRREPDMDKRLIATRIERLKNISFGPNEICIDAEQPLEEVTRLIRTAVWSAI